MSQGNGMRATLQRRMLLLGMIPRQPRRVSAPALVEYLQARGLSTTLRTIERDLEALSLFLPLGRDERDRPYGRYWLSEASLQDVPAMDPETALTLADPRRAFRSTAATVGPGAAQAAGRPRAGCAGFRRRGLRDEPVARAGAHRVQRPTA